MAMYRKPSALPRSCTWTMLAWSSRAASFASVMSMSENSRLSDRCGRIGSTTAASGRPTATTAPSRVPASRAATLPGACCGDGAGAAVGGGGLGGGGGAAAWLALGAGARSSFLLHPRKASAGTTARATATTASLLVCMARESNRSIPKVVNNNPTREKGYDSKRPPGYQEPMGDGHNWRQKKF